LDEDGVADRSLRFWRNSFTLRIERVDEDRKLLIFPLSLLLLDDVGVVEDESSDA
jgi:hypothetical protein